MNAVFYFSGTGNSRHVARSLAALLGDEARDMARTPAASAAGRGYARLGFVCPVHAWGLPVWVRDYLRAFPPTACAAGCYVYVVLTCGDDTGLADRELQSVLRSRGVALDAAFSVRMPNTYVSLPGFDVDPAATVARKLAAALTETARIAADVRAGRRGAWRVGRGVVPRVKSYVLRPLFRRFLLTDRYFRVLPSCDGCRACSACCPVGNIRHAADGRPRWTGRCTGCLACYHHCPRAAIHFGPFTRGKGRYAYPALRSPVPAVEEGRARAGSGPTNL